MQLYVGEKYKSNMFLTRQAQRDQGATLQALTQKRVREWGNVEEEEEHQS